MLRIFLQKKSIDFNQQFWRIFSKDSGTFQEQTSNCENISEDVLNNLVCPLTKKVLRYDTQRQMLINDELSIGYKIVNGIPNMIPSEAVQLEKL